MFYFSSSSGHSLTLFVRHCAEKFLNSEHKEIRYEAVKTCSRLLSPSLASITSQQGSSSTAKSTVSDVLNKLLVVGITDSGKWLKGSGYWLYWAYRSGNVIQNSGSKIDLTLIVTTYDIHDCFTVT